jgi:hypothetical protein
VAQVLNTRIDYVNPQYHVLHDDAFTTVPITGIPWTELSPLAWHDLLLSCYERYLDPDFDHSGHPIPPPMLNDEWLTGLERVLRDQLENERRVHDLISRSQSQREQTTILNQPVISNPVSLVLGGGY